MNNPIKLRYYYTDCKKCGYYMFFKPEVVGIF